MVEWSIAPVLKTGEPQGSVGSNPTPSAIPVPSAFLRNPLVLVKLRRKAAHLQYYPLEVPDHLELLAAEEAICRVRLPIA